MALDDHDFDAIITIVVPITTIATTVVFSRGLLQLEFSICQEAIPIDPGITFVRIIYALFIGKKGFVEVMVLMDHGDGNWSCCVQVV